MCWVRAVWGSRVRRRTEPWVKSRKGRVKLPSCPLMPHDANTRSSVVSQVGLPELAPKARQPLRGIPCVHAQRAQAAEAARACDMARALAH